MNKAYFKYIAAVLMFGFNGIVASRISLSSYEIVLTRTLLGSVFLIAIFLITRQKPAFLKHKKQSVFLAASGIAMGASWMFLYEAYAQIGVSIATLIYYCGPVIVMALSPLVFGEKLTLSKVTGFLAVLCGVFLVNGQITVQGKTGWGLICGILSAVTYAVMVIANKKAKDIVGLENSMLQLFTSFITVAVFVGLKQGFAMQITQSDILPILVLGLFNTGVGCYFYFSSIGYLPVQTVAVCGYLEPLSAVVFSVLLLGERLSPVQIIGAVLILGGAIAAERIGMKKRQM